MRDNYLLKRTEILIVFANNEEFKGFKEFISGKTSIKVGNTFFVAGREITPIIAYNYHICCFLTSSPVGGLSISAELNNVANYFENLAYIVNIGCCATAKKKVEKDVIFAEKIFDADLKKEEKRGTKYYCSENKHLHFDNAIKAFVDGFKCQDFKAMYEPIISSSSLVRNFWKKRSYLKQYPTGKGIEMEGKAVSDYALQRGIEWMLIKGTSDNAIKKDSSALQRPMTKYATQLFFGLLKKELLKRKRLPVFVGGAVAPGCEFNDRDSYINVENDSFELGKTLYEANYKVVNGLGLGVGTSLLASAYDYCISNSINEISECVEVFPFPRMIGQKVNNLSEFYRKHRKMMIDKSLIGIFIFGDNSKKGKSNGLQEEYDECGASMLPRFVIPTEGYYSCDLFDSHSYKGMSDVIAKNCKKIKKENSFSNNLKIIMKSIQDLDEYFYN